MYAEIAAGTPRQPGEESLSWPDQEESADDCCLRRELDPSVVWDAFESYDEMQEPEPEFGDFWGQPDNEQLI